MHACTCMHGGATGVLVQGATTRQHGVLPNHALPFDLCKLVSLCNDAIRSVDKLEELYINTVLLFYKQLPLALPLLAQPIGAI